MAFEDNRHNLKKYNYDNVSNFFNGRFKTDKNNLSAYNPFIPGYAFIIWMNGPTFLDNWSVYKTLLEQNFKSFSGLGDMTLAFEQMSMGFTGNEYPVATNITKENTSFTLKHIELAGSPISQVYTEWVTGIRDPETGLATYNGKVDSIPYSAKNHSGELLYIVTDPSLGLNNAANSIEFAAYYTNVIPTKVPLDHLNYTSGDHGIVEIDIEFRGNMHISHEINLLARTELSTRNVLSNWKKLQINEEAAQGSTGNLIGVDGLGNQPL